MRLILVDLVYGLDLSVLIHLRWIRYQHTAGLEFEEQAFAHSLDSGVKHDCRTEEYASEPDKYMCRSETASSYCTGFLYCIEFFVFYIVYKIYKAVRAHLSASMDNLQCGPPPSSVRFGHGGSDEAK